MKEQVEVERRTGEVEKKQVEVKVKTGQRNYIDEGGSVS